VIAARELTADHQPDDAVDFVAACSSAIHDDGGRLEWRWLGESHVRLSSQLPGMAIVTLDVRELTRATGRIGAGCVVALGDVVQVLRGRRRKPGVGKGRRARR
jgi:hypothetical protein